VTKTLADLIEDRFGLPTGAGRDMPAEGELAQILGHRSHRRNKPDPVPDGLAASVQLGQRRHLLQVDDIGLIYDEYEIISSVLGDELAFRPAAVITRSGWFLH